jgi:teichuronic acid biosynthesis glycosyltransferase TuaG
VIDRVVAVSVIVPTYNRLELLRQTLDSVFRQASADWELVVVDDGSTDNTVEYLNSLRSARVRSVELSHSGNLAVVRNAGVMIAIGDYLAFLDSDDLWEPEKLAIQIARMRAEHAQWSYTAYDHIDSLGRVVPARSGRFDIVSGRITERILTAEVAVGISTLVVSTELFRTVGMFDEDPALNLRQDYNLALRLSIAEPVLGIPDTLSHVREHAGRITNGCDDAFERIAYVYRKFADTTMDEDLRKLARAREVKHLAKAAAVTAHD